MSGCVPAAGTATEDPPAQQVAFLRQAGPQHLQVICGRIITSSHMSLRLHEDVHTYLAAGYCAM